MKVFKLEKSPHVYTWSQKEECDDIYFGDLFKKKYCNCLVPDVIFYWYVEGYYEGSGSLIAQKDKKWFYSSLSHCSCYGPLDGFAKHISEYQYKSLNEVEKAGTCEWLFSVKPLIDLARSKGYK